MIQVGNKQQWVQLARLAEQVQRFDQMRQYMINAIKIDPKLTVEEKNYFSISYRHNIYMRKASLRNMHYFEAKVQNNNNSHANLLKAYRQKIEEELLNICNETIEILDSLLIPNTSDHSLQMGYYKMKADIYEQISKLSIGQASKIAKQKSEKSFKTAQQIMEKFLHPAHPTRLGLALSYAVFNYEINGNYKLAQKIAKKAFQQGLAHLQQLKQNEYKDSSLILQLLRQNLLNWQQTQVQNAPNQLSSDNPGVIIQ